MSIFLNFNHGELLREKWFKCRLCANMYVYAEIFFDSGSVEPTVDETLTGDTSTNTGVVVNVNLVDGTWAGGDAEGWVELDTLSGYDLETWSIFQDNETVTGTTGGADMFTVDTPLGDQKGDVKKLGILHPRSHVTKSDEDGHYYCANHYPYRWTPYFRDKEKIDIRESKERGHLGNE